MQDRGLIIISAIVLIIGGILGFILGKWTKKCPEIKVGKETLLVTITIHDTIIKEKTAEEITVGKVIKKKKIYALKDTVPTYVPDTTVCYSFEENEPDGAYIGVNVCSDSLPLNKPLDLTADIAYRAPPDTQIEVLRTDTVMVDKTPPFYKDWKVYALAVVSILMGVFVAK